MRFPRDTRRKTVRFSQEQLAERFNVASSTVARVKPEHDTDTARSVAVRETADGYTNRPTGMKPVRYASVAPRTQRHPPVQGGTPRHTDETAR